MRKNKDEVITGKRALNMIDKNAYLREPKLKKIRITRKTKPFGLKVK